MSTPATEPPREHPSDRGAPPTAATAPSAVPASSRWPREAIALAAIVLLGAGARLWWGLRTPIEADEATVALAGYRALHGHPTLMEANGHYLGAWESYVEAPFIAVFGTTVLALRAALAAVGAAYLISMWALGRRLLGGRGGLVLAAVASIFPIFQFTYGEKGRDHGEIVLFAAVCFLLAARAGWPEGPSRRRDWILLGIVGGVGLWNNLLFGFTMVPVVLFLAWRSRALGWRPVASNIAAAAAGFVAGFSPYLLYNVRHPLASLSGTPSIRASSVISSAEGVLNTQLPIYIGTASTPGHVFLPGRVALAFLGLLAVGALARLRHLPSHQSMPALMVLLAAPVVIAQVVVGPNNGLVGTPRYLMGMGVSVALAAALVLTGTTLWRITGIALAVPVIILSVLYALGTTTDRNSYTDSGIPIAADRGPMLRALEASHPGPVYATYWLGRPLVYLSAERLQIAVYAGGIAFPDLQHGVDRAAHPSWLFMRDDPRLTTWMRYCAAHDITYHSVDLPDGGVLERDLSGTVRPRDLGFPVFE